VSVNLSIDGEVVKKAKEIGINLSQFCENKLRKAIELLEDSDRQTKPKTLYNGGSKNTNRVGRLAWLGHLPDASRRKGHPDGCRYTICDGLLEDFNDFLVVDLRNAERTAYEKVWYMRKFLSGLNKPLEDVTRRDVREFLRGIDKPWTYKNALASFKTFFRDYLQRPEIVESFRFPTEPFKPKTIPKTEDLVRFYYAIETIKGKALFLLYATSGLRRNEILTLLFDDVDFQKRMITPNNHKGTTKNSWVSFYNEEAERVLREYLQTRRDKNPKLFPMSRKEDRKLWRSAREKTGLDITPKQLRDWFCEQMSELGVAERYIDAFCGRVPKSILAKHYTDYSPEKLKAIYDKAGLKVLTNPPLFIDPLKSMHRSCL